ncbi:FAD dependent oxidoreductase/monooxygenase [Colletotrichum tofieldiae]|nr:FAD dependent oxidoreductase/monooxygenase [Colletotrichum tofieldiae]GKT91552.1 FAD dependent oxidoreductase/monooxygenase [Colletotrichum tofieldiae]
MASFKVIIVGGGLSGSLLANGLMNNDVNFTLYERDPADSKREGYQIRLGDAAMEAFECCLKPDHVASIRTRLGLSTNQSSTAPIVCTSQFKIVLDLSQLPNYSRSAAINRVVLRNLLLDPVETAGHARFGKAFSRYEIICPADGQERVKVHFADGSSDTCDVLVGADGSGSRINKQVGARNIVDLDSHLSFVQKGSLPPSRVRMLPRRLLQGPIIVFSEGCSLFFALYLPPARNGVTENSNELDYDAEEASFYWGLSVPREMYPNHDPDEGGDHLKFCLKAIEHWSPEYHTMLSIGEYDGNSPVMAINTRASRPLPKKWRRNLRSENPDEGHPRLLQLNEAAKSGKPPSSTDVEQALAGYEPKMLDRAFAWVRKSGGASIPVR